MNTLRINNLVQAGAVKFAGVGDHNNVLSDFTHPTVQARFVFIMGTDSALEADGVDAEKKDIEVVILQRLVGLFAIERERLAA